MSAAQSHLETLPRGIPVVLALGLVALAWRALRGRTGAHLLTPLLLLGGLLLAGVRDQTTVVACLIAASAPAAAATTMFSAKFNQDTILSVGVVSFSTLLSLATMPLVVGLARYLTAS